MRKVHLLSCAVLLCAARGRATNSSVSPRPDSRAPPVGDGASVRRKRFIGPSDAVAILDYHNQVRANVFPPAANMEHMRKLDRRGSVQSGDSMFSMSIQLRRHLQQQYVLSSCAVQLHVLVQGQVVVKVTHQELQPSLSTYSPFKAYQMHQIRMRMKQLYRVSFERNSPRVKELQAQYVQKMEQGFRNCVLAIEKNCKKKMLNSEEKYFCISKRSCPFVDALLRMPVPPDLASQFDRPEKEHVVASFVSRFSQAQVSCRALKASCSFFMDTICNTVYNCVICIEMDMTVTQSRDNIINVVKRTGPRTKPCGTPLDIGDPAYPLQDWLMKPFSDTGRLTPEQHNYRLSSALSVVEMCFGRLKGRWRCLIKRYDCKLELSKKKALTCCVLRNICEEQNFAEVHDRHIDIQPQHVQALPDHGNQEGANVRAALMNYFNRGDW
ncbi:hypothetical protein F2P81_001140 [Scophthalmus maximus]|uniref:DDE Tnp4 domain-containing protein n=1 Tax=Scophthalmus maximus TaxID=52904 RepID=A0A6A4TKV4_SCOMX|nr:hypothetical protein F2P81_001140 [Scophthalmus maximus]